MGKLKIGTLVFFTNPAIKYGIEKDYANDEQLLEEIFLLKHAGLKWVRLDLLWSLVNEGGLLDNWVLLDRIIKLLRLHQIEIIGVIGYNVDPLRWNKIPEQKKFLQFVEAVVKRYQYLITYFEIWNEPNHPVYFDSQNWIKDYIPILNDSYQVIKNIHPEAIVLNGGLTNSPFNETVIQAVNKLYEHNAYFDLLNVHFIFEQMLESEADILKIISYIDNTLNELFQMQERFSDCNKKIIISEIGVPCFLEGQLQADFLEALFELLKRKKQVDGLIWAFWRDTDHFDNDIDFLGLVTSSLQKKSGWHFLKENIC